MTNPQEVEPTGGSPAGDEPGCLTTLASPSCFGFLAFVGLLIAAVASHDLAI
ncbi:hypothetical protein [Streptomyces sp. WL006]|uniref:hypothetical protein n=1 Tax=Streptomyces sp. WL006 TaxID=3423915 RepID=UPI003F6B3C63